MRKTHLVGGLQLRSRRGDGDVFAILSGVLAKWIPVEEIRGESPRRDRDLVDTDGCGSSQILGGADQSELAGKSRAGH